MTRSVPFLILFLAALPVAAEAPRAIVGISVAQPLNPDVAVSFPTTAVGKTSFIPCRGVCFFTGNGTCNYSGRVTLSTLPSLPFRASSFRRGVVTNCGGTPATFPLDLAADEVLWFDLDFAPVSAGNFSSSLIFGVRATGNATEDSFSFDMTGLGVSEAKVLVSESPAGMLQLANQSGGTDKFSLTNVGSEATTVTLSKNGNFFNQSPTTISLGPNETKTVNITGTAQSAGSYVGASNASGDGVPSGLSIPIKLLSSAPPTGSVIAEPSSIRPEASAPVGTNPSGGITYSNPGTSALQGLVSTEVPWLVPQDGTILIPPGGSTQLGYVIDNSKRPDSEAPIGSVSGKLTISYLTNGTTPTETALFDTGFEPTTYSTGPLTGKDGWGESPAIVQTAIVKSGAQAVSMAASGIQGQAFVYREIPYVSSGNPESVVRLSVDMHLSPSGTPTFGWDPFTVHGNGGFIAQLSVVDGVAILGLADSSVGSVPVPRGVWNRFELVLDHQTHTVTAFVNGSLIGSGPFANPLDVRDVGFGLLQGAGTDSAYFDNFRVTSETGDQASATSAKLAAPDDTELTTHGAGNGMQTIGVAGGPFENSATKGIIAPSATPPSGSTSVVVVAVAVPPVGAVAVPPLGPTESALFVPSVANRIGDLADVYVSNVGTTLNSIPVRLFYTPAAGVSTSASSTSVNTVQPAGVVAFTSIVKSVFAGASQVGTVQLRTSVVDKIALDALLLNLTNLQRGSFGTSLPVFRSDSGIAAGAKSFLPGLRKDVSNRTDLYVQETTGAAATVQIDLFNASGAIVGTIGPRSVPAFGLVELADAIPAGVVSASVTNSASSTGRVVASAIARDSASGDPASIVASAASTRIIVPLAITANDASGKTKTEIAIMNTGSTPASGVLEFTSIGRRRAVRRVSTGKNEPPPDPLGTQTISLGPFETRVIPDLGAAVGHTGTGRLAFTPTSGSVAISSRILKTAAGRPGAWGSTVTALPTTSAMKTGEIRTITGLGDSTAATIQAARPVTWRTHFGFVETAGGSAVVRATVRYAYPVGAAQARAVASREFPVQANEFVLKEDMVKAIIGVQRETVADLRDVQIEFQIVSGNGQIIPFTWSTDNGSGDMIVRVAR